ncbi:MAG TPA: calcium/sodium antiporter [Deinococcales bacterium]|nr:calcium/sodium antiporter [Deinococcales bacterium]
MLSVLLIAAGAALLAVGGNLLVQNASRLSRAWGVSPLVVGLTVVAFGTSSPEIAASLTAALQGSSGLAMGNVFGSNIFNVLGILGMTALLAPLNSDARFLRREMPIMFGSALLLVLLLLDGRVGFLEGALFLALLAGYLLLLLRSDEAPEVEEEFAAEYGGRGAVAPQWRLALGAAAGILLLVVGARALVAGAVEVARALGTPELLIGLTVVALGTSLPEVAASVAAALKREPDIALGNIVGSNIFNVLAIVGVTAVVRPLEVPFDLVARDAYVMLAASALLIVLLLRHRLGRLAGGLMLSGYVAYTLLLVATA